MRLQTVRFASIASKQFADLARWLTAAADKALPPWRTRTYTYDGALIRTRTTRDTVTSEVLVLPVYMLAVNLAAPGDVWFRAGKSANVQGTDLLPLSRDMFYVDPNTDEPMYGSSELEAANIPQATAYGDPMPDSAKSINYSGSSGKLFEGYATLRSTQTFSDLATFSDDPADNTPMVDSQARVWVEAVVVVAGDRYRRFTFSEAWLAGMAPGRVLVSRSTRFRVTCGYIAMCSNGRRLAVSLEVRSTDPFDPITNNQDNGVCDALTFCLDLEDLDDDGKPVVVWHSLWDRQAQGDLRVRAYSYYPEDPYDPFYYQTPPASGRCHNTVASRLEMTPDGGVFGVRTVTTALALPYMYSSPHRYITDIHQWPINGQVTQYVEWSAEGVPTVTDIDAVCEAGVYYYNMLVAEPDVPPSAKTEMLGFLDAYAVADETPAPNGVSAIPMYSIHESAVGYSVSAGSGALTRYVSLAALVKLTGVVEDGSPIDTSYTSALLHGNSTYYVQLVMTESTVDRREAVAKDLPFESVLARVTNQAAVILGFDKDGFDRSSAYHANALVPRATYVGAGKFAYVGTRTDRPTETHKVLVVMSYSDWVVYPVPGPKDEDQILDRAGVRTVQEELPPEDPLDPLSQPTPCVIALTDDAGVHVSRNGGESWVTLAAATKYDDLIYLANGFVESPMDKTKAVG